MAVLPIPATVPKENQAKYNFPSRYVGELRSKIGYYIDYVPEDTDLETFYNTLRHDAAIDHSLDVLGMMVSGDDITVDGVDPICNSLVFRAMQHVECFGHARKSMCQKSVLFGLSIQKKYWRKTFWEDTGMVWEVPCRLKEVDRRRLRLEREHDSHRLHWTIWTPEFDAYVRLDDRRAVPGATYAIQDYLWTFYEEEEQSPYYRGKGEVLFALAYMHAKILQYWGSLAEHWGQPFLDATISTAEALFNAAGTVGSGSVDIDTLVTKWLDLLQSMRARHSIVKTGEDQINIHEAGSTGNNILKELCEYLDLRKTLCILGSELTTAAPSVGSYALGEIHQGVLAYSIKYIGANEEETLTNDLAYDFYLRNRLNFYAMGVKSWPGPGRIRVKISRGNPNGAGFSEKTEVK